MIVVTGSAGFIGSSFVSKLNEEGYYDIVLVDDFSNEQKNKNLDNKRFSIKLHRNLFPEWARINHKHIEFIFHLGARTDTTEFNYAIFENLNVFILKKFGIFASNMAYHLFMLQVLLRMVLVN